MSSFYAKHSHNYCNSWRHQRFIACEHKNSMHQHVIRSFHINGMLKKGEAILKTNLNGRFFFVWTPHIFAHHGTHLHSPRDNFTTVKWRTMDCLLNANSETQWCDFNVIVMTFFSFLCSKSTMCAFLLWCFLLLVFCPAIVKQTVRPSNQMTLFYWSKR